MPVRGRHVSEVACLGLSCAGGRLTIFYGGGSLWLRETITAGVLMPFKSQAQRRKFAQLLVEGKISNETFEEWNRETGGKKLPENVKRTIERSRRKTSARRRTSSRKK